MREEGLPSSRAAGADPLAHHADHHVGQLRLAAVGGEPGLDGGLHVAADRRAIDPAYAVDPR